MLQDLEPQTLAIGISLICMVLGSLVWSQSQTKETVNSSTAALKYPPSPPERHWLWKHGASLVGDGVSSHDVTLFHWMKKLNSKVVRFEVPFMGSLIVVGDAQVAKHVLQSKAKGGGSAFPKSPTYKALTPLVGKKSILVLEGPEWSHQRRVFNPGFTPDYLRGTVATICSKIDRFLTTCETEDIDHQQPTNLLARSVDLTSDVIAQVAFGEDWGYNSKTLMTIREILQLIQADWKNPLNGILNPFFNWKMARLSRSADRDMRNLVERRIASIQQQQQQHSGNGQNGSSAPQKDILSLTLASVLKANQERNGTGTANGSSNGAAQKDAIFSEDDMECVTSQLKTFYFAGHDTTATTIAWAYWLLIQDPQALQTARDEVAQHLGADWVKAVRQTNTDTDTPILPQDSITYEALQKCQYLEAVSRETLRLYPPGASTRIAADPNASFGTFKLGGQSKIHINMYAIQRDPDLWGPDATEFQPERFLGETGKANLHSSGFLPFSRGSRDCIGKYFALLETKMALAALIVRYEGDAVNPDQEIYAARVTNIPKNGCLVQLSRRG